MNIYLPRRERLKVDREPRKLRIESEPYVVFLGGTFVPVVDVYDIKKKREFYLPINASSISGILLAWAIENSGRIINMEFWINKESDDKFAKYQLEIA
jgi:hypothetical protein